MRGGAKARTQPGLPVRGGEATERSGEDVGGEEHDHRHADGDQGIDGVPVDEPLTTIMPETRMSP